MTTPLRAKYIRDLAIRGRAERTQQSYSRYVSELARYYHRSPEHISYQEVADWLYYLIKERELSASSVNIAVNAVRFLYGVSLERNTDQLMASVPRMKHAIRRAEIYALLGEGVSAHEIARRLWADFLVLSFRGNAKLPAPTRYWIERWSWLSADGKPALVALVEKPKTGRGTAVSTLAYLRNVAAIKGIYFSSITFWAATN